MLMYFFRLWQLLWSGRRGLKIVYKRLVYIEYINMQDVVMLIFKCNLRDFFY